MTHFEYIAVIVSIILGLGIVRLLGSLDQVFSKDRYWPHAVWVITIFWLHVQNWWAFWDMRTISFNIALYIIWIVLVSLMYLCSVALTNRKTDEVPWKEHYYQQKNWFFGVQAATIVAAIFVSFIFFGTSFLHPYRALQLSLLVLAIVLIFSDREKVHEIVSVLFLSLFFVGFSIFRFFPGLFDGIE